MRDRSELNVRLAAESVESGVEEISDDGSDDTAEERVPAAALCPERRQVLHGEQQTSNGSVETGSNATSYTSCGELSSKDKETSL